jgi:hypothetical protein
LASLDIDDSDFRKAAAALERHNFQAAEGGVIGPVLRDAGNIVRRHVRTELAPHRRSGKTASHVTVVRKGAGLNTTVTVKAGGRTAHLLEGGTKEHDISAGKGRGVLGGTGGALTIRGAGASNSTFSGFGNKAIRGAGQIVVLRGRVHHPGTRPDPFFEKGVAASRGDVQTRIDEGASKLVTTLAAKMR